MRILFTLILTLFLGYFGCAQGVGINEMGISPHPSAGLDVNFNNKGLLLPRMTTAQRDSIQNPAPMLIIANTTTNCLEIYISPSWQNIFCGCSAAPTNLNYTDNGPLLYCANQGVTANSASTQASTPSSYTITPALPAGLLLNNSNGQITGTPTVVSAATNYTLTASNGCGATTRVISIGVLAVPAPPGTITGPSAPTVSSAATYSISAVSTATSYTWAVPAGWIINSGQGTTTINVTAGTNAGNVTVTAANHCGTSAASTKAVTPWRPIVATGGTITNYTANGTNGVNGVQYRVHSFTTVGSSSFNVTDAGTDGQVNYLIVGGGGGGGKDIWAGTRSAGGGGAGGLIFGTGSMVLGSTLVVVGQGGSGGVTGQGQAVQGGHGGNSSLGGIIAYGGGGGTGHDDDGELPNCLFQNQPDGSGGGGANCGSGCAGIPGQGNAGGAGCACSSPYNGGGGGGGAGGVGENAPSTSIGGKGGDGLSYSITGVNSFYAGGGGGTSSSGTRAGGQGGGGASNASGVGTAGTPNTGGGGGGARGGNGGNGGSGIVIIRYPLTNPNP